MQFWLDLIRENFLLKLFSLGMAILIYVAVNSHLAPDSEGLNLNLLKVTQKREFRPPVQLMVSPGPGQGYKVTPETVLLTVSGEVDALKELTLAKIQLFVRLEEAKGPMMGELAVQAHVPRAITIESIDPPRVSVETVSGNFMIFPIAPIK